MAELSVLSEIDRARFLVRSNNTLTDTLTEGGSRSIHEWFEEQVRQTPDRVAVVFDREQLTYQQLNRRANQLAHHLKTLGVEPETLVGICIERSVTMVVALLAVLKAGGAYVPFDPSYPIDRLTYMLADSRVRLLLTTASLRTKNSVLSQVWEGYPIVELDRLSESLESLSQHNPDSGIEFHHLAYVLYTSGSTGKPKGVMMEHGGLANLINWHLRCRITGAKTLQFAPLSFDISFHEIFSTWCSGGTLVLVSEEQRRNPDELFQVISKQGIEKLYLPFTALQQLARVATRMSLPTQIREVMTAGEQLKILPNIAQFFEQIGATLHNHYGATECQDVTAFTLPEAIEEWETLPPIGRAIDNIQIYLLDDRQQPVPQGNPGELYVGGAGIARGYLNRPDLTRERFIANPFGEGRLYKTGDLARTLLDGNLQHLGRADRQVKLRGFRIELGEIEGLLAQHPTVQESAVILREDVPDLKRLVAYIIPSSETKTTDLELTLSDYLRDRLPEYMVPTVFAFLDRMPLTPSGKLDRQNLPVPKRSLGLVNAKRVLPRTETERQIARVWQQVLRLDEIGVDLHFFEVGGTSLLLLHVYEQLTAIFGDRLNAIATLFQYPTIETLAQHFDGELPRSQIIPLGSFCGHRAFSAARHQRQLRQSHRDRQIDHSKI
ncbi:MAG: amino acid adenylation domain-containing protein [Cyanobacteriota bacterium]|nr:amino acid adenylation domain-containing protein [Cyanobacteriota bacterium]